MNKSYTFDDVILIPRFSDIRSRSEVDLSTEIAGYKLKLPIISANMSTVTEYTMAAAMYLNGGLGILHRYADLNTVRSWIQVLNDSLMPAIPSIGIKDEDFDKAVEYELLGVKAICIDIAHGDSLHMWEMIEKLKKFTKLKVIAGNVATYSGAGLLADAGADVLKVGIGGGSNCTTRVETGHGRAQLTSILEVAKVKDRSPHVQIIADGGVRNPGDFVKALAAGADAVMTGSLLAGCTETPGKIIDKVDEHGITRQYKIYAGMASAHAQYAFRGSVNNYTPEGITRTVLVKGHVSNVLDYIAGGMRSGFSYSGARNIKELQEYHEFELVTQNGYIEGTPHGLSEKK